MKKLACFIVLIAAIIGAVCVFAKGGDDENSYIRIHIRANSNSEYDQAIKYDVKDSVVGYLIPLSKDMNSKEEMYSVLESNLVNIKRVVDSRLDELGQNYDSQVRLNKEEFPTRDYDDLTLEGGVYDALIIELGTGTGDNWWCVAFPPLCFNGVDNGTDDVQYKSKFKEWLDNIFG